MTEQNANFNAEVKHGGTKPITKYGFVWSKMKNPKLESAHKVVISEHLDKTHFSKEVHFNFDEEFYYYVRAFIETEEYLIYGSDKNFFSLGSNQLEIDTIFPLTGTIGDTVYIQGKNFKQPIYSTKAHFHRFAVLKIISNDSLIAFVVP